MMKINKDSKLYNLFWYMFGSMTFGFTSLIYAIITTRVLGIEEAGQFSFAFAVACTFYVVGVFFGRTFQVTDTSNRFSDTDYIYNKVITCSLMIILTLLFCLIKSYSFDKLLLIIILTLYRGVDAFVDAIHGVIQKKDKIYKLGKISFYKTVVLVLTYLLSTLITHSLVTSCILMLISDLLFVYLIDYRIAKNNIEKTKFNLYKNSVLLIEGFSVFLFSFLAIFIMNSPKYAIDNFETDVIQGIFAIIVMPASFLSLVSIYLVQPFVNEIASNIKNNKFKELTKLTIKLSLSIIGMGLCVLVVGYLLGIPVLNILYGVELGKYKNLLMIILIGSIVYSLYTLLSTVLISMRKNLSQDIILLITSVFAIIISNLLVKENGIEGASYAYLLVMLFQLILYIAIYIYYMYKKMHPKRNKIAIRLMGGLGNQMFQYASLRAFSLDTDSEAVIDLRGITNKTHNVYGLDHCNISKDVKVVKKFKNIRAIITHLLYGLNWVVFMKIKDGYQIYEDVQPMLNKNGIYCVPGSYIELGQPENRVNYMVGYFQDVKYMSSHQKMIRDELQITDELDDKNKKIYEEIQNNNSVCIHIRRGDYIGSNFEVCNNEYYYNAVKLMNSKIDNPNYYIFSDGIDWVKANMDFGDNKVTYIDWKNNQYIDLKLMSGCKNFIMSNSSFSFWAQFLSQNDKKIVIAPSRWFNDGTKGALYSDDWDIIDVDNNKANYKKFR